MYFDELLPRLVKEGSDGNAGSSALCDTTCLQVQLIFMLNPLLSFSSLGAHLLLFQPTRCLGYKSFFSSVCRSFHSVEKNIS
ncbi:chorismate mutase1 [Zea mays]|jgi:hypothetical protein|uniref:chorismate mutase n=1 Tax=Zea mays TaxID=4577 RepID=A0A1D6GAX6_MAIZE|nr:chorismate mutase1 [Zea mays]